jgi:hypothetical protein
MKSSIEGAIDLSYDVLGDAWRRQELYVEGVDDELMYMAVNAIIEYHEVRLDVEHNQGSWYDDPYYDVGPNPDPYAPYNPYSYINVNNYQTDFYDVYVYTTYTYAGHKDYYVYYSEQTIQVEVPRYSPEEYEQIVESKAMYNYYYGRGDYYNDLARGMDDAYEDADDDGDDYDVGGGLDC